jgi:energy-coupling factor transporter transmembrane protein EcfT
MRTSWHDTWGCARGPAARLVPQVRLMAGAGLFAACMIAPAATLPGALVASSLGLAWLGACRPPLRVVRTILLLGLVAMLPYFLLVAFFARAGDAETAHPPIVMAAGLLVRGLTGLAVSVATVTTLRASDLREALVGLPVPGAVSAILLQIVHQMATLAYETRRVALAIAVRGASTRGLTVWRVLSSLPQVWLPRIVQRADRVAAAMELRGYCDTHPRLGSGARLRWSDGLTLVLVLCALALAIASRCWSPP